MPDVLISPGGNKPGGVFNISFWRTSNAKKPEAMNCQEKRRGEEDPRNDVHGRKGIVKPRINIKNDESQQAFKSDEAIKSMTMGTTKCKNEKQD